jgi:uncharacterized protein (TIGR00369 family)
MNGEPRLTLARARSIVADTPFASTLGYQVVEVGPGAAVATYEARSEHLRPGDVVAGPILMGLADLTFWIAVQASVGEERMALTLEEKSVFLRPARGPLRCEARVIKAGRRVVYGEATVLAEDGAPVTHHTLTYLRPDR